MVVAMDWTKQVILVTGGTGSFGKKFIDVMLKEYHPAKLIVFSRESGKRYFAEAGGVTESARPLSRSSWASSHLAWLAWL